MNELLFNGTSGSQGNTVISLKNNPPSWLCSIVHLVWIYLKIDLAWMPHKHLFTPSCPFANTPCLTFQTFTQVNRRHLFIYDWEMRSLLIRATVAELTMFQGLSDTTFASRSTTQQQVSHTVYMNQCFNISRRVQHCKFKKLRLIYIYVTSHPM